MAASPIAAPAGIFGKGSFIQRYSDVLIAVAIVIVVVSLLTPAPEKEIVEEFESVGK